MTCPRCSGPLAALSTRGPGETYAAPCGCRVDARLLADLEL